MLKIVCLLTWLLSVSCGRIESHSVSKPTSQPSSFLGGFVTDSFQWTAQGTDQSIRCGLQEASLYGWPSHVQVDNRRDQLSLQICRDSEVEILHLVELGQARVRDLVSGKKQLMQCTFEIYDRYQHRFTCRPSAIDTKHFEVFDAPRDLKRLGFAFVSLSAVVKAQRPAAIKATESFLPALRYVGVKGNARKPCEVEVKRGEGIFEASVYSVPARRKLVNFLLDVESFRGANIVEQSHVAFQSSWILSGRSTNHPKYASRLLVLKRTQEKGLGLEVISRDGGGAATVECFHLTAVQ